MIPVVGSAQVPQGPDFQINSYTTGDQYAASVAVDADGAFVVVWRSPGSSGTDSSGDSVQGQRYDAGGNPLGDEFQVNSYTSNRQWNPSVAVDPDGDFVVVWQSNGSNGTDSSSQSVQGQRYDANGNPLGSEFQVNSFTANSQRYPSVAVDSNGDFAVVWRSRGSAGGTDSSEESIQGQRYDSSGNPLGDEFQVNSYTTGGQHFPSVAIDPAGDIVVVWESPGSTGTDSSEESIQGQRYDSSGNPLGDELQINSYTSSRQWNPSVAVDSDGTFVVVWESQGSSGTDSSEESIQGQRYDSSGNPLGSEFQVNSYTTDNQWNPSVAVDPYGAFIVVWESEGSNGTDLDHSIQGQRYASSGNPLGNEFQVNSYTTGRQYSPSVAVDPDGDFVVVWESRNSNGTDSSSTSIQGRRFLVSIFSDGFESGNVNAWSASIP